MARPSRLSGWTGHFDEKSSYRSQFDDERPRSKETFHAEGMLFILLYRFNELNIPGG